MNPDSLAQFRRWASQQAFAFGRHDCGLFCADWVLLVRGVDPALLSRGRYSTELGLARFLKRRGGIVAHFDACLAACHIGRTDSPRRGDIAIVETPQGLTGGIVTGSMIMLAAAGRGVIVRHMRLAPIVAAWRI